MSLEITQENQNKLLTNDVSSFMNPPRISI